MAGLSPQSYKGARDWYPEDMRVRDYIFSVWKKVVQSYGYEAYDAPLLEPIEIYLAKSGQELATEQTYTFTDRGDRQVAIRPEMTPSVSRMVAARRQELAYPARWYSIDQFMRYERPQRGREREFWQLNVDIFGADTVHAEAEIIIMGARLLTAFGASDDMFTIRINNRRIINFMMAHYLGLDGVQAQLMIKLFDRKNKISPEEFRTQAEEIFGDANAKDGMRKIIELTAARSMADLPEEIRASETVNDIQALFTLLERAGVKNAVFDITLMRGLDYYTGTVFEFFDMHPENRRSLFGGGRYDGLVGLFGAEPLSAVGMAPGLTMTELFLRTHDLLPPFSSTTDVYVVVLGDTLKKAQEFADQLRKEGINTELDFTGRKLDKQIKTAIKKHIPYLVFYGENEATSGQYPFKDTEKSEEQTLSFERIVSTVKDRRARRRAHMANDELDEAFEVE